MAVVSTLWFTSAADADVIVLQPAADASLIEVVPDNNLGGHVFFNAGTTGSLNRNRGLMFFDLSTLIPAGSIITGVELAMDVVQQPDSNKNNSNFSLRRMLVSWGEGAQVPEDGGSPGRGAPAASGESTWNHRFATGVPWSQPGGAEGVDYSDSLSAVTVVTSIGEPVLFASAPGLVADVQAWADHPEANFGWMLKTELEDLRKTARGFASRESGFGPTLTIEFTPVPEPGVLSFAGLFLLCLVSVVRCRKMLA